ncbi:MAG: hypothetical protein NTX03_10400 [Bacteroidetes bacterium]|nr:hypothetical protein [Bacteroidota bacterium]
MKLIRLIFGKHAEYIKIDFVMYLIMIVIIVVGMIYISASK